MIISYLKLSLNKRTYFSLQTFNHLVWLWCSNPVRMVIFTKLKKMYALWMDLVVHHCRQFWEWPRDDIRLWHISTVYRRWMGNTETCIKYLCHYRREVCNKEACVCALTLYRANNTVLWTKQIMWLIKWMSTFCEQCLQLHVHSWLCLYRLHMW